VRLAAFKLSLLTALFSLDYETNDLRPHIPYALPFQSFHRPFCAPRGLHDVVETLQSDPRYDTVNSFLWRTSNISLFPSCLPFTRTCRISLTPFATDRKLQTKRHRIGWIHTRRTDGPPLSRGRRKNPRVGVAVLNPQGLASLAHLMTSIGGDRLVSLSIRGVSPTSCPAFLLDPNLPFMLITP
jgi:hypothetical protein